MPNGTENASKDCYREQNRETLERKNPDTNKSPLIVCRFFFSGVSSPCAKVALPLCKKKFIQML